MAISDKAKNEETFLDKIICKNKIKDVEKLGLNDIKYLKSLLDVPSVKLYMKSSRNQSKMKESYKKLYKDVCKYLDSMKKSCLAMKRYKSNELMAKVEVCSGLKAKIEGEMGEILTENLKEARTPVNVKAIKKIDELTIEFNKFRAKDSYKVIMEGAKVNPRLETYNEFEPRMRMKRGTNMPLIMVKEFLEEKKQLKEKEMRAMFDCFVKSSNKSIKDAKKKISARLDMLAGFVGLSKGKLNKYLSSKEDFEEINNGLYNEVAENLMKVVKETISEYNKKFDGNELEFTNEEELKSGIRETVEKKAKDNGNAEGWWGCISSFFSGGAKDISETLYNSFVDHINWNGIKEKAKDKVEDYLKLIIKNFLSVWSKFEASHKHYVELMEDRKIKLENLNELDKVYDEYIENISKALEGVVNEKGKRESKSKKVNIKDKDRFKLLVKEFNRLNSGIKETISKIRRYYNAAFDSAECVKGSIEVYIDDYKGQFSGYFKGKSLEDWVPNENSSKLTLGQAILFTHYCISKYEEECFGLGKDFASYLEESERMTLGITTKELKNIIANS